MSHSEGEGADVPERWTITLRPLPGWNVPGAARIRRALKTLLRSYGLKCVEIRQGGQADGE